MCHNKILNLNFEFLNKTINHRDIKSVSLNYIITLDKKNVKNHYI